MRRRASDIFHYSWLDFGTAFLYASLRRILLPWRDRPVDSRFSANRDAMEFDFDCDSLLTLLFRLTVSPYPSTSACLELFADDINFGAVVNPLVLVSLIQFRNVPIDTLPGAR
jgi:hypothetical protein